MEDFISEDMRLSVKRGANWLDENHPNWEQKLDLDNLMMMNCSKCVIGQAVGDYYEAIAEITNSEAYSGQAIQWAVGHGFDNEEGPLGWGKLETLWTEQVEQRLRGRG